MATSAQDADFLARRPARGFMADQPYFTRFTICLALLIVFGFAQFSLRGFVDVRGAPLLTHVHGALMLAWVGIAVAQNVLVGRNQLSVHRPLGWLAFALVLGLAVIGVSVGVDAVAGHRQPPFFSVPYFLALTMIEPVVFAAMVAWGVTVRRKTQWHRRLMLGSMIVILEPALGRLLPMPLMGAWGEWTVLAIQLLALAVLGAHDRKVLGRIHPATFSLMAVVVALHLSVSALSALPPFAAFAEAIAAG